MKKIISIVLSLTIVFSFFALNITSVNAEEENNVTQTFLERVKDDYDLVWNDEFNGDTLDTTKWQLDGQIVHRNSELQVYADSMDDGNLAFDGENAIIVPKVEPRVMEDGRKYKYTSAEISTQGTQTWKYGYFEIRAKVSSGKNIVPAIWTLGYDFNRYKDGKWEACNWPHSGEIDIMESFSDNTVQSCLHFAEYGKYYPSHNSIGAGHAAFNHKTNEEFHNYWLYWTDKYIIIGIDDAMHNIIDITTPDLSQSFRNYEHWLILNVALGMFANPVDDSQEDLWKMWIDYVRVYQLNDDKLYDDYKAFGALDLKHNGREDGYYRTVTTIKGASSLDFTIQDELEPGKYDVYAEFDKKDTQAYINGVKTNEISKTDHGKAIGNQAYVGSVDLQDRSNFDVTFKTKDNSTVTIEKLFFIKTDDTKTTPVVVNKDNGVTVSDYIEVSSEDELISAVRHLKEKGIIKLLNDITLTKSVYTFNEPTFDLNGKTLTVNGGRFAIHDENKPSIIKNGNVIISGSSANFISTRENNYKAKVKCEDLNITINSTAYSGCVFDHYYANIGIEANNCEFTFGEKVSSTGSYIISKNAGIYNNCTFNLDGRKAFLMGNGSGTSVNKLYFNNCVVNDALYLFHSNNALTNYVDVKLANTCINNLGSLSNFTENAQFVSVADNSTLKQNGETVGISADMTGNFTMECAHNYVDADCLLPKHCEYCSKSEGKALGHTPVTTTTPAGCLYKGSIKTYCETCSEVFSEKAIPVLEHNYVYTSTNEPSCNANPGHHLWSCTNCDMTQQRSYNYDGVISIPEHTFDESKTVVKAPTCTLGGCTEKYCTTCNKYVKLNYKLSTPHDCTVTVNYENNTILYDCKDCDYTNTVPLDTCPHTPVEGSGIVTEPTCKAQGYTEYTCSLCSKTYKTNFVEKLASCVADTSLDVIVPPTLANDGYTEHTCKFCGEKFKTDIIPTTGDGLTIDMTTLAGAAIRLNDKTGLRFYTEVDEQKIAELREDGYTVELGTLIAPYDVVRRQDLTFDLEKGNFVVVKYQSNEYYTEGTEFSGIVGSIVNIKETTTANSFSGNINRKFVARGYAKITDNSGDSLIIYADYDKHDVRSLGYVSQMLRNDTAEFSKDTYIPFAEKVNFWADRYVIESDPNGSDKWL